MPQGKIKMINEDKASGFVRPDGGGNEAFFHISALREGDEIAVGNVVAFEIGADPKSEEQGRHRRFSVRRGVMPRTNLVFPTSRGVEELRAFREEHRNAGI
jgi:cold shock CspA family protein